MKTLHLTNAYHGSSGGIRTFYSALLDGANRERRQMVLVVPGAHDGVEQVGEFGRVYKVQAPYAPAFDRRYRLMLPWQYCPGLGRQITSILERERPDLVEVCDKYSLPYLAMMLRKAWHRAVPRPTLVGLSCERFDDNMAAYLSQSAAARRFTRWYIRNIYGPPFDYHVANSGYTAEELHAALPDRPADFIHVCPPGVDASAFGPHHRSSELRSRLLHRCGGTAQSTLLFYAGRLSPEKHLELLVETLTELTRDRDADYRLLVAGDGPRAAWLREQTRGPLRRRIVLCGNLDRVTLAGCYASCDVFVHVNPREPFGIGPLEAMASGAPVVVPAAGGVLEYATATNAFLAEPNAAAFAAAVRRAVLDGRGIQAAAQTTVRAFDWPRATQRYFALYDELHARRLRASNTLCPSAAPMPMMARWKT